ncbi:MAG: DUF3568 family protein, partial [Verrucomicrobia bacterium]|nr:DUF3568 family protein [Verrucomicrobiota bacterium]
SGCAVLLLGTGAAAGAGTVVYYNGQLRATEDASLDRTWSASQSAMKDLQIAVVEKKKDGLTGYLRGRSSGAKRVTVNLKRKTDQVTEVRVRVGYVGDKVISQQILDQIRKDLPQATAHAGESP